MNLIDSQVRFDGSVFVQVLTSDIAQASNVDAVVEDPDSKMYMTGKNTGKTFAQVLLRLFLFRSDCRLLTRRP